MDAAPVTTRHRGVHMPYQATSIRRPLPWLLALLLANAACDPGETGPARATLPERPATQPGVLQIEGMEEPVTFRLFRSPPELPVQFSTYVPPDMIAEAESEGEGAAVRFVANFAGRRDDRALLHLYVYPPAVAEAQARAELQTFATSRGVPRGGAEGNELEAVIRRAPDVEQPPRSFAWSIEEFPFFIETPGGTLVGNAALGFHGNRFLHVVLQYPEEMGDGFGPRAAHILREWRWEDTGEMLGESAPPQVPGAPEPDPDAPSGP
jgi:hypothetical protein